MMRALERNAEHHRKFGKDKDPNVPEISPFDRYTVRLAALLHDIGHGPFSHVTEQRLRDCAPAEFDAVRDLLLSEYEGTRSIAPSELLAVMTVLGEEMKRVLEHPNLELPEPTQLAPAIVGRILGSRTALKAGYLSGVVSGPIDADKLDYMARDSLHAGLPIGLDLERLISKLEVVTIRPDNVGIADLRARAEADPSKRIYEMGISLSGVGAYEQMIIGRVILYDRLYHHHKIRTAESMVRRLIAVAKEESDAPSSIPEYLFATSDEIFLGVVGGEVQSDALRAGGQRSRAITSALINRRLYHRAYVFAAKYIDGLEGLPENEKDDTRFLIGNSINRACLFRPREVEKWIYDTAMLLAADVPALNGRGAELRLENIIVDLPAEGRAVSRGNDILIRTENGEIVLPTLYFDPEKWSEAYQYQKLLGLVLAPREHVPLVATAAKIVFYECFLAVMNLEADKACKTIGLVNPDWISAAADKGLCSPACRAALIEGKAVLAMIRQEDIRLPEAWRTSDPKMAKRLANAFGASLPSGIPASIHRCLVDAIENLAVFIDMADKEGLWATAAAVSERDLQTELRKHLRSRDVLVTEGSEVGGGETDLILPGGIVVENKVRDTTRDPFETGANYEWQVRRYSISTVTHVSVVVVAYKPADEAAILPLPQRIRVMQPTGATQNHAFVRVVIPWGHGVPSSARNPDR